MLPLLSLSLFLKSPPWRRRSAHVLTRSRHPPRMLTRRAATRTPTRRRTRLRRTRLSLDWFWGQYDLCLWKLLPPAEKARRVAFKKEMAEQDARYQATCEARDVAWKKEAAELWGWAHLRAEEVYEDGYFIRKARGTRGLVAVRSWANKLRRATDEELRWAPNEMARSFARVHLQEADWHVKRCEAEEAEYCLCSGKTPRTRELLARGCRKNCPGRDY